MENPQVISEITLNEPPKKSYDEIFLTIKNNIAKLVDNIDVSKEDREFLYSLMDNYVKEYLLLKFAPSEKRREESRRNLEHYDSAMCSVKNTFKSDLVGKIEECIASIGGDLCQTAILSIL